MMHLYCFIVKDQTLYFSPSTLQKRAVSSYQSVSQTPVQTNPPDECAREVAAYSRCFNSISSRWI
jgi:hypothetical protein